MINKIRKELENYKTGTVEITEGHEFSQSKLVRRIMLFKNQTYPNGKKDSQGNYKFWFDIISPRVDSEIKNIDFDTKDITLFTESKTDTVKNIIANAALKEYLRKSGQAAKLNDVVEQGTEWGNVVWKKIENDYKIIDLTRLYVLNQTAETLQDSDVIEADVLTQSELRKKKMWKNVDELLNATSVQDKKTSPEFYIYERNGEITTKEYYEAKELQGGDENEYIMAKVIAGGTEKENPTTILYCEEISETPYKEYHRGKFCGRWFRLGMYETLFDIQVRANEIGNQIAQGLKWSSKTIFRSKDRVIAQNVLTDLQNGDIVKSEDLSQVNTRMIGLDQLIADWNRLMELADKLANSYEVVTGETLPSGTPFSLGNMMNINANKLFDYIREKLGIAFEDVLNEWIVPDLLKELKTKDIIRLTGDDKFLNQYYEELIKAWYVRNLVNLPPHSEEAGGALKEAKLKEMKKNKEAMVKLEKGIWIDYLPRVDVNITGENFNLGAEMETLKTFVTLEGDSVRRTALIELAMAKKGIDASSLPKSQPLPQPIQGNIQKNVNQSSGMDNILNKQKSSLNIQRRIT